MSDQILEYSSEIDKKVAEVVSRVLNEKVKDVKRINGGEVNYVYKVETEKQTALVRIARYKDWPDTEKLTWIFKKLAEKGITHPKVLFSDLSSEYFKFGFLVSEWIGGKDGTSLIKEGKFSGKRAVEKIAETLQKIHQIDIGGFGEFNGEGKGEYETWEKSLFNFFKDSKYKKAVKNGVYGKDLHIKGVEAMKKIINELNYKPKSVLTHQDPTPENAIFYKDKVTLVDWDNAKSSVWIEDLAWITFWMGKKVRRWFLEVYKSEEPLDLIEKVEKVIHMRLAITLIPYYLYSTKNYKAAEKMKRKLRKLVSI